MHFFLRLQSNKRMSDPLVIWEQINKELLTQLNDMGFPEVSF